MAFHPLANANSFWDNIFQEEDEAKAAEDGENQENWFSSKDAIVFLIDATKEMFVPNELGEIPFHNAIKCAVATLTDKIISSDSDLLGICFYGTVFFTLFCIFIEKISIIFRYFRDFFRYF